MPRCLSAVLVLFPILVVSVASGTAMARTWYVDVSGTGDAPSVQAGIDSAAMGDTVLVEPGTYNEQIDFLGKDIVVKGEMGAAATILDGTGLSSLYGVQFFNGETRDAILEGVTVRGSRHGVVLLETEPSILKCICTGNGDHQYGFGGGIIMSGNGNPGPWSPLIRDNIVTNNVAGWTGSGIAAFQKMTPEIVGNTITGNHAGIGDGGGIYLVTDFNGSIIRDNWIEGNFAGDHGGGIYVAGRTLIIDLEIADNVVIDNVANGVEDTGESGGGIWLKDTNAWVHHNTIVENTGNGPNTTYGGAIVVHHPGSPLIEQNILAFTQNGGGIFCHSGVTATIRNNLAWQNVPVEGVGLCDTWGQGDGNLVADPQFCALIAGDLTVAESSPAMTHPAGPLGAFPTPGCAPTVVERLSWGTLKTRFGN